ncbi:hypothetical protein WAJ08_22135, partial [Acinetobacter baumannii]
DNATGTSVSSIASAQAQVTAAQVNLDNLINGGDKDDVAQAQAQLQSAQAALDQAKGDLTNYQIVAPFDGVIGQLNLTVGEQTS